MHKSLSVLLIGLYLLAPTALVLAETEAERRARLEAELQTVERQILTQTRLVEDKQMERQSLERDVNLIEGEIKKAQLGIQARSVAIMQLSDQIGEKEVVLSILEERTKKQKDSLADLVRKSSLMEDYSLVEVLLSKQMTGKSGGFGFRNYWASAIYKVMKAIPSYRPQWKKGK